MHSHRNVVSVMAVLLLATSAAAQKAAKPAVIWYDRGDAAALNLLTGPGGRDREPGTDFRFIKESLSGTSPKFEVEDENGVTWKAKLGEEVHGETAAARLLWAVGYVVDEDYYRSQIHVRGMEKLTRGQQFVSVDGLVTGVRLERDAGKAESSSWSWYDNPLLGTREFNGLRVMMALINNWDLKPVNNTDAATTAGDRTYSITDLGSSFGRTGDSLRRSKGLADEYARTRFIDKVTPTHVDFVLHSRPFFPSVVNFQNYRFRTRMESIVKDVPLADARWIGDRLTQLSATQIGDCFRAGGFSPADVLTYTQAVMRRITALKDLPPPSIDRTVAEAAPSRAGASTTTRLVPLRETLIAIPVGTPHGRAVMGGFEQGGGIGIGGQVTTAHALPAVELRATALASTHNGRRYELDATLPHVGSSRTHADVWFTYLERSTNLHSVGPDSFDRNTQFDIEQRSYQGSLSRDLAEHLQTGVYAQAKNTWSVLDELSTRSTIASFGAFLSYDTRDNSRGLTRGVNLFGRIATADGLGAASSGYGWVETEVDARGHLPLGGPRTALLVRSRAQFKSPRHGGEIPYYDLSWLGGRAFLRGAPSYRYRGNNVLLLSSELQRTVVPLSPIRGVDVFGSADTGQVWTDPREFTRSGWESGLGGGVQYRHSPTMAARIDMSRGAEGTRVYMSLSRGF